MNNPNIESIREVLDLLKEMEFITDEDVKSAMQKHALNLLENNASHHEIPNEHPTTAVKKNKPAEKRTLRTLGSGRKWRTYELVKQYGSRIDPVSSADLVSVADGLTSNELSQDMSRLYHDNKLLRVKVYDETSDGKKAVVYKYYAPDGEINLNGTQ